MSGSLHGDFPSLACFSFLHVFYFVHLGRKTVLTAQSSVRSQGCRGRRGWASETCFQDHIETGATWAPLREQTVKSPGLGTHSEPGVEECCAARGATWPFGAVSPLETEAGKAPPCPGTPGDEREHACHALCSSEYDYRPQARGKGILSSHPVFLAELR